MTEADNSQSDSAQNNAAPDAAPGPGSILDGERDGRRNASRSTRLALALIVGLAALFFARSFREGFSTVVGAAEYDALKMFYPLRAFANGELQDGRLPLWNPYVFCGHPFHAEGQGAIFYPLNLVFAPLPGALSMSLFAFAHFALAGIFFFAYLRAMRLSVFGALLGALAYSYSSAPISRLYAGHYTIIPFLALVPAFLWVWELWRREGGPRRLAGAIAIYGSMILAGYPQLLFYASIYFSVQTVLQMIVELRAGRKKRALRLAWGLTAVVAAGVALGAAQLAPSYQFAKYSFRQEASYEFSATFSFAPENVITLLAPLFFGDMARGAAVGYWGRNYLWEMWIYLGVLPLALAVFAAARVRGFGAPRHCVCAALFAVLALGGHTPLFRWLYDYVPFFNFFRGNSKFILFAQISLLALAAIGAERMLNPPDDASAKTDRKALGAILGAMMVFGIGAILILGAGVESDNSLWNRLLAWRFAQGETYLIQYGPANLPPAQESWAMAAASLWRMVLLAGLGAALALVWNSPRMTPAWRKAALLALAIPELFVFSHAYFETASVEALSLPPAIVKALREDPNAGRTISTAHIPNMFAVERLETVRGYAGNILARYNNFQTAAGGLPRRTSMVVSPMDRGVPPQMLWPDVRHMIVPDNGPGLPAEIAEPVGSADGAALYRLRTEASGAYFSANPIFFPSAEAVLDAVESGARSITDADLVEIARGNPPIQSEPPEPGDTVRVVARELSRVEIETSASGPRLLITADAFEPNWRCRIDGEDAVILPANIAFRAVEVPAGEHRVVYQYAPTIFYWGLAVTCLTICALAILSLFGAKVATRPNE